MWIYLLAILILLTLIYLKMHLDSFKKWSHLPGVKPHWFFGNRNIFTKNLKDIILDHYNATKGNRYCLFWSSNEACIFLHDLELIKKVQVTDSDSFLDTGFSQLHDNDVNQFGMADMRGEPWKKMKRQLTPSFSTPRLKKNVDTIHEQAHKLVAFLQSQENEEFVDAVVFSKKFYAGCLASVGFGLNIDVFSNKVSEFEKHAMSVFSIPHFLFKDFFPNVARLFGVSVIRKTFSKYVSKLCRDIVKQRKTQNLQYKDMLNNLIEVSKINTDMTDEIMYNTAVQFFSDGYESASFVVSVLLYYLTVYPETQVKLQEEIDDLMESKEEGEEINAEDITNMNYLDQVINEGLRLAPVAFTGRTCTKEWQIPGDSFVVPKGTRVIIPIAGLHFDSKYWQNPTKFDPERFSSENKSNIDSITFQTFGSGPRQCLGKNLYIVETKVMLIHLLRNFSLKPYGHMPKELEWDMESFIGKKKIEIKLQRRENI